MENRETLRQIAATYKKLQEYPFMSVHPEIMANRLKYQTEVQKLFDEFGIHNALLDSVTMSSSDLIRLITRLNEFIKKYKINDIDPMTTSNLELETKIHKELYNTIIEADEPKKEDKKVDDKLHQLMNDMNDISTLISKKFTELKKSEDQLMSANSYDDEYGKIQKENMIDSLSSIKKTLVNLGRTYQFFLEYIEKYGYNINNKKKE